MTIRHHINTPAIHPLIVMALKHVLLSHRAHRFIVNVQPRFPTTALSAQVEHVDRIVPAACILAVVVKQLVVRWLSRLLSNWCHDF